MYCARFGRLLRAKFGKTTADYAAAPYRLRRRPRISGMKTVEAAVSAAFAFALDAGGTPATTEIISARARRRFFRSADRRARYPNADCSAGRHSSHQKES